MFKYFTIIAIGFIIYRYFTKKLYAQNRAIERQNQRIKDLSKRKDLSFENEDFVDYEEVD